MYRYYSTEYPISPIHSRFFANTVVSFKEKNGTFPGVGSVWGYLEYEQQLSADRRNVRTDPSEDADLYCEGYVSPHA